VLLGVFLSWLMPMHAAGQVTVARVSVELPEMESFLLQATVPVMPGTFLPGASVAPLAFAVGGQPVPTQVEAVSLFPRAADGAAVVELIARVPRPNGALPGSEAFYDVIRHDHAPAPHTTTSEASRLLAAAGSLMLRTQDVHGNIYAADLTRSARLGIFPTVTLRNGRYVNEYRTHEVLTIRNTPIGTALPHMMGVHATFRTYANEEFVGLDLHVHNGMDGRDSTRQIDDTVHHLYFDELLLDVPAGWQVLPAFEAPYLGAPRTNAAGTTWPLIKALPENQLHILHQQAQFSRRFVLARTPEAVARGRQVLQRRTFGFVVAGNSPQGLELWSWWNPSTAGYLPQRHPLPLLAHEDPAQMRAVISGRSTELAYLLRHGLRSTQSGYPFEKGVIGWAQPWGVEYGGMSGGVEIEQIPGVDIAWARAQAGLRLMEIKAQCYEDRQPNALYNSSGRPTKLEDQIIPQGTHGPWFPTYFSMRPTGSSTHFAFKLADQAQSNLSYELYRVPHYQKDLLNYHPIDFQHLTRYLNGWLVLAWLTNDAEAKRALELHAELFRLSFTEYPNSNYGHIQETGLLARMNIAQAHGGKGGDFGRGTAWGLQAATASYALNLGEVRARYAPWFAITANTSRLCVSTCTGNPSSLQIDKHFKGLYQSRQSFEVSFYLHAVQGLRRSVFEGVDPVAMDDLTHILVRGAESTLIEPYWDPVTHQQRMLVATREFPLSAPDFCTTVPTGGIGLDFDRWTAMTVWAYAYGASQNGAYLVYAAESIGTTNALQGLEAGGLSEMGHKAPMFALLQVLGRQ